MVDLKRCLNSLEFPYYAEKLLLISSKYARGLVPLKFNAPQHHIWNNHFRPALAKDKAIRLAVLKARQEGVSTLSEGWLFYNTHMIENQQNMVVAHDREATSTLIEMSRLFYRLLPKELKPVQKHSNIKEIVFQTDDRAELIGLNSALRAQTAGWVEIGRSKSLNHLHCSEIAYWPAPGITLDGLLEAVGFNLPGSTVILESTANGVNNWWYSFWKDCEEGVSGFEPVFLPWFWMEAYRMPVPDGWNLTEEELYMKQAYNLKDEQLVWYRMKKAEMLSKHPGMGERRMKQEYPSTPEEAFISSGQCAFPVEVIENMLRHECTDPVILADVFGEKVRSTDNGRLKIWELPNSACDYALGVDVSAGTGRDASVIEVLAYPGYRQVAEWRCRYTSPLKLAPIIKTIAVFYNNALVAVETNNHGLLTNTEVSQNYYRLYQWEYLDRLKNSLANKIGWETNLNTKKYMIDIANHMLIEDAVTVVSADLCKEMLTFLEDDNPQSRTLPQAENDCFDDRVMAWMIALVACYRKLKTGFVTEPVKEKPKVHYDPIYYDTEFMTVLQKGGLGVEKQWWL